MSRCCKLIFLLPFHLAFNIFLHPFVMALPTAVLSNWLTRVNDHRCLVAHLLQAPSSANCVWGLRIVGADFDDRKRSTTEPPLKTMKHHAPPLFFLLSLSSLYPYRVLSASPRPSDISTPLALPTPKARARSNHAPTSTALVARGVTQRPAKQ